MNMQNKMVMVTGANAGIGKVTARELAKMGATVIMVARSRQRGEEALAEVKAASGNENVVLMLADLSSQDSIRQLAVEFKANYDRLHVLVNNAGAIFMKRRESVDGLEMTFALNHLGYYLLTMLLLETLQASAPARIVNVTSGAHFGGRIQFADLQMQKGYAGFRAYSASKLANVLFTYELARRLAGQGVTVNCLHPGFVASNFAKNNGLLARMGMKLLSPFALSSEEGAETSIYLASSPEVEGVTGKYFAKKRPVKSAAQTYDEAVARRLWKISGELVRVDSPV